ncbi:unnamed protein product [Cladocopium goreaui]|uniref:Methyltransferase domain-containing protein n=1 Tax=Cladocopium goreaui TaxID=2562237 RepID=A0A9P1BXZ6_9DINO|nr:unnamed protein product [Cladocopium goreaui]
MDSVDDTDPGLAGLSPEFQAMLGGLAGHTASFAKILEKRTTSTEKDKDDEVYLESYADLAIHEEMLKDTERVDAYRRAIDQLGASWSNSTVVDVGAGTGVLSVMCGKRAKKVVAIEASRLSHFLRKVVATNAPNVEVHDARAEDLELTEKVDVVVSEWMGYCLLFENMLPSVLSVRDRYLKPGGMMLPSKCRLLLAPLEDQDWRKQKLDFWTSVHGIDMSSLIPLARATYCGTPQHHLVDASKLLADPQVIFEADLHTVQIVDLEHFDAMMSVSIPAGRRLDAFVAWFECDFPGDFGETLSTAPTRPATHWKQTAFYLREALEGGGGCEVQGTVTFQKHEVYSRGYQVSFDLKVPGRKPRSEGYELR